ASSSASAAPSSSLEKTSAPCATGCFLSSRRRHTSWPRDWSSDVCSSDLDNRFDPRTFNGFWSERDFDRLVGGPPGRGVLPSAGRSEERRVGKECSSLRRRNH